MKEFEKNKVKNFIRYYNGEEIQSMNFIFGKNDSNNWFTQEELSFVCNVDLHNKVKLEEAKADWFDINFE